MNNKKNFKSEYSKYIQNIKPSDDLIKKTLELANKEQEKIQKSKEKSSMRFLYNINFKKLSALACTLVFAIFAVKLWNDIDKQPVPVKPNIITDTTTDTSTTQSDVTTAPVEFSSDEPTSSIDVSTIDTLTDSTSYNSTCSSSCITDSSTVYNNENIYTTTSTPNDSTSTDVPNSINDNTSSTTMTTNKNSSAINSNSHKFTPTTTTTTTTTTSKHTDTIITSTTKTTTTTSFEYIDTTASIEPAISCTTKPSSPEHNSGDSNVSTSSSSINAGGMSSDTIGVGSSEVANPVTTNPSINITFISTTTHEECTTMAETTSAQDNSINSPTGNAETKRCMAIRVSLLNVENGFFEDSTIYKDRIMDYLPYGKELMGIIPLGKTSNSDCDCILIFNAQSLAVSYGIHSTEVIKDLNNYEYSKIEIVDNPTNDNASQYLEFQMLKLNLDFNNNGLGAEVDLDDRNTLLSMLTIDDAPLE